MIIANPIYDVVFKYLLEDIDIARELLSTILGEEVLSLELKPQEMTTENAKANVSISILRFDFKAVIKTANDEQKKVLIELQKAKKVFDVMRFRRYLGDNYRKEDDVLNDKEVLEKRPLPIVTIYFLGFPLDKITQSVIKVSREYRDAISQELIEIKEDFIELLTHDSYLIQIGQLKGQAKTKLERVLHVFSPQYKTSDKHQLDFQGDENEPLVRKMLDRLGRAIASEDMRDKMDVEDEIDRIFEREIAKVNAAKDLIIAEKEKELQNKSQELQNKSQELEQQRQKAETERRANEELRKQIEELRKQVKD